LSTVEQYPPIHDRDQSGIGGDRKKKALRPSFSDRPVAGSRDVRSCGSAATKRLIGIRALNDGE
jgi:hypothetical protein